MKRIIIYLIFANACINVFSQSETENMLKYWHYRNRLKYFVVPGKKQGESELIVMRNCKIDDPLSNLLPDPNHKYSKNGDQTITFGFYIGMLATEYKLLSDNGRVEEATNTLHELDTALFQFEFWLDQCEDYYGTTPLIDGYFVRDNVPIDFMDTNATNGNGYTSNGERHLDLLNKDLTPYNVWDTTTNTFHGLPAGHPGYCDYIDAGPYYRKDSMSQDMAIGLLKGLSLVNKFCPYSQSHKSEGIACNVINYIQNYPPIHGNPPNNLSWSIYTPLGDLCSDHAGVLANSYGFFEASKFFHNSCVTNDPYYFVMKTAWDAQAIIADNKDYNSHMAATLAAIGKSWHISLPILIGIYPIFYHYFHIDIPATGWGIKLQTQRWGTETFYLLLYEALQNKSTSYLSQGDVNNQINSAPCEGPYDYQYNYPQNAGIHALGGWATTNRFHNEKWQQDGTVINPDGGTNKFAFGNYSGLDYMLLYNLNYIINGGIPYENYNDRYLSGNVVIPNNFVAFNTITSTQDISYQTIDSVTYKAGKQIELKPGFHAQEGSTFHAYIENVGCGDNFITDTISQAPVDTLTTETECVTDSLPAMPCGYDTLHFNGIDGDTAQYSYAWSFPGGSPSSSTIKNPSVYYANPGTYQITLQVTDTTQLANTPNHQYVQLPSICINIVKPACYDSSGSKMLTKKPENSSNYQVNVFPNPTTGIFNVSCSDNSLSYSIEVSDVIGNIIYNVKNANGIVQFDLSSKPKGIYFVKVKTSDSKTYYRKIIYN